MEFGDMLISTGVDALIKLVREKGKIELTLASRLLNIPISTIEEWSHALEEEGIISVEYQLTKVYLKWTSPTEEKVEEERAELAGEKEELVQLIKKQDVKAQEQMRQVSELKDEFAGSYGKIMGRIDELGKTNTGMSQSKAGGEEDYYKAVDELAEMRGKIGELGDSVKFMREQLEKTRGELAGSDMEKKMQVVLDSGANVASLKKELEAMEKEVSSALASLKSSGNVDVSDLKGPMEEVKAQYSRLKGEMEAEVEHFKDIAAASEVLLNAKEEVEGLRASTKAALAEAREYRGTLEEMEEKISSASGKMKEAEAKAEKFKDALTKTEEVLGNYKIDEKSRARMEALVEEAKTLQEKMDKFQASVQEAFPLFENVDKLMSSLSELRKKIGEERKRLAEESGAIFSSLDEEAATYSTFQKIKEKAASTINDYLNQLEKIEVSYEKAAKDAERTEKKLDEALDAFKNNPDYKGVEQMNSAMDALLDKKKLLEQVKSDMDALDSSATKTAKQVRLLAKEAELLELRAGSAVPAEREQARKAGQELRDSVSLTETEQKDFDSKREELRKLIKKLWEEE